MKTLCAVIAFGLCSCERAATPVDHKMTDDTFQLVQSHNNSITIKGQIDPQLKVYLDKEFNGWTLPAPNRWDAVWFNQYKSDTSLVNYVTGDFNCDGMKDYALLLIKANGTIGTYAYLSTGISFNAVELVDFGKDAGERIEIGLELLPPGDYNHIDLKSEDDPHSVRINCSSVQVVNFERAAEAFYWDKGELKSITTGD